MKRVLILVRLSLLFTAFTLLDVVNQQMWRLPEDNSCRCQLTLGDSFSLPVFFPPVIAQSFTLPVPAPGVEEASRAEAGGKSRHLDTTVDPLLTKNSTVAVDRQAYVSTKLSAVTSRIAVAQARTAKVRHDVESEREIETAAINLQIATRNRHRYADGESQLERTSLENQVQLARDRQLQLKERVVWSESLANGGLISQAALEIDVSAVKGSELELKAAQDKQTVFETFDRESKQTQLEADVLFAQAELNSLQHNAASKSQELQSNYLAVKRNQDNLQTRLKELSSATVIDQPPLPFDPVHRSSLAKDVELAHSAMLRAEQELATAKQRAETASLTSQRLLEVQQLRFQAFLKSRQSGTMHELSSRIRMISEQLASDEQELTWSRRVIRKGYITQAEMRSAELSVNRRKAELAKLKRQENILAEHTLGLDEFELKAKLSHASKDLKRQQRLTDAQIEELTVIAEAKRHAWKIRQEELTVVDRRQQDTVADAGSK